MKLKKNKKQTDPRGGVRFLAMAAWVGGGPPGEAGELCGAPDTVASPGVFR